MADPLIGATAQVLLERLLSLATERMGFAFGFKKDVQILRRSVAMIQAVLADAEEKQLEQRAVKLWLERLEGVAYEADNIFDKLNYEMLRLRVEIPNPFKEKVRFLFRWRMASKVREINMKLKLINEEARAFALQPQDGGGVNASVFPVYFGVTISRETDSIANRNVVGRANDVSIMVEKLLGPCTEVISFVPITGMGGLGKTTLAQLVYNHEKIDQQFGKKIWIHLSERFEVTEVFKLILESLIRRRVDIASREVIVQEIRKELEGKRYLLVLDDMWNESSATWANFLCSLEGISSVNGNWSLVTTRKVQVASVVTTSPPFSLEKLSDNDCWSILKERAFPYGEAPTELKSIRKEITKACQGLPLAASVIGGLLRINVKEEWLSIVKKGFLKMGGDENSVLQILKLSFDNLPSSSLKKCFAYCGFFRRDFQIEKENLIQLWMAEGFLQSNFQSETMEDIGSRYFNILVQSSLLEEVRNDLWNGSSYISCRMHDLVYHLARLVSKLESPQLEGGVSDDIGQVGYLWVDSLGEETKTMIKGRSRLLRTLNLKISIPDDVLLNCKYLRVLNLSRTYSKELPTEIDNLLHLRYLDLSYTGIKSLPESLCKLYNLQTLRIISCKALKGLPKGMSNLISLRHLQYYDWYRLWYFGEEFQMPVMLGKLTCLQTLEFFRLGEEKGLRIEEVGCLKSLSGELEICNLELVNGKEEAQQAALFGKPKLNKLTFKWAESREGDNDDENVLEGLQPHPNLESLVVENFMGARFPLWLMNMAVCVDSLSPASSLTRLDKLVNLTLNNCKRCRDIPAIFQLPFLQELHIYKCPNFKSIPISNGQQQLTSLRKLDISDCDGFTSLPGELVESCKSLRYVNVSHCRSLVSFLVDLQQVPSLSSLWLYECPKLITVPKGFGWYSSLTELTIGPLSDPTELDWSALSSSFVFLLRLYGWPHSNSIPDQLQNLTALTGLELWNFGVEALPDWFGNFVALEELKVYFCKQLQYLPSMEATRRLTKLHSLWIFTCPLLEGRCTPPGGPDSEWSKISHIPQITINYEQIQP